MLLLVTSCTKTGDIVENMIESGIDTVNEMKDTEWFRDDKEINQIIKLSNLNLWDNAIDNGLQVNGYRNSTFRYAIENGTKNFAYYIIDHGVDVEYIDEQGQNELMYLNKWIYTPTYEKFVGKLTLSGCDVNSIDKNGHTVLEDAILKSTSSVANETEERKKMNTLLKSDVCVREEDIHMLCKTPYNYYAALKVISEKLCDEFPEYKPKSCIEAILLNDREFLAGNLCNENHQDYDFSTFLFYVVALGDKELIKEIVDYNSGSLEILDDRGNSLIMAAAATGNADTFFYLKDYVPRNVYNKNQESLLTAALAGENKEIVNWVFNNIDNDWNYNTENSEEFERFTQLISALSYYADKDFFCEFLSSVDMTEFDLQRLAQELVENKNDDYLAILLKHPDMKSISLNADICESIIEKCSTDRQVEMLLDFIDADIKDKMAAALSTILYRQQTILIENSSEIIKVFFDAGINLNQDNLSMPFILAATHAGDITAVIKLIEYGIDVNAPAKNDGRTPLMIAAMGDNKLLQILLDHGAEVNTKDNTGATALRYAVGWSSPECVKLLLDYGADKDIETDSGLTLYEIALKKGNDEVTALLKP